MKYGIVMGLEALSAGKPVVFSGQPFREMAKVAAELGYDGIELHMRNPAEHDPGLLKAEAPEFGLGFCGIATGMEYLNNGLSLISDDPAIRRQAIDRLKEHIDFAAVIECPVVIGIMRANLPQDQRDATYLGYHTEALRELAAYAKPLGVPLLVENITRYINNYLNTCAEICAYLDTVGCDNIGLHLDTHSMNIEEVDLAKAIVDSRKWLQYVHFSDSNRKYPGGGNIDFQPLMRALKSIGYDGYITFECVPLPTAYDCAKRSITLIKALDENIDEF